jgi:inosine/xanthosine triphosphate pyrophosphatase family protein
MTTLLIATRNAHKAREIRQVLTGDFQFLTLLDFPAVPDVVEDGATFAANAAKKAAALADWLAAIAPAAPLPPSDPGNPPREPDRLLSPSLSPASGGEGVRKDRRGGSWDQCASFSGNSNLNPNLLPFHVLADDSGLEVDALGGAPGVHSARFAALDTGGAGNSSDAANNAKLLCLLGGVPLPRRTARFRCVLALKLRQPSMVGRAVPCPPSESSTAPGPSLKRDGWQGTARPASPGYETILFEGVCPGHISLQPAGTGGFGYDPLFIPDGFDKSFAELGDALKNTMSHRARALQKLREYLTLK